MSWHQTPCSRDDLPEASGSYVLEFDLDAPVEFGKGRFEGRSVGPGRLRYYGSAHGPGGLAARVARHLDDDNDRLHWHVDYLTDIAGVVRIYVEPGAEECELLDRDRENDQWETALDGFGATDCSNCDAHLLAARNPEQNAEST